MEPKATFLTRSQNRGLNGRNKANSSVSNNYELQLFWTIGRSRTVLDTLTISNFLYRMDGMGQFVTLSELFLLWIGLNWKHCRKHSSSVFFKDETRLRESMCEAVMFVLIKWKKIRFLKCVETVQFGRWMEIRNRFFYVSKSFVLRKNEFEKVLHRVQFGQLKKNRLRQCIWNGSNAFQIMKKIQFRNAVANCPVRLLDEKRNRCMRRKLKIQYCL